MSFWKKLFGASPSPSAKPPQPKPATPEPPKPAAPAQPTNVVEEAKDIIRNSKGARDFLSRATLAGWSKIKEDFIGIYLKRGDATLIFGVLPSHGPDTIWNAMMTTKDTGTVYLITEGKKSGAVAQATSAVECLLHDITGQEMTLGKYLDKYPSLFHPALKKALDGVYGYASDAGARHGKEGREPSFDEAQFAVTTCAAACSLLTAMNPKTTVRQL